MSINISASVGSNPAQIGPENKGPSVVEAENNKATVKAQQTESASRQQAAAESRQAVADALEASVPEINQAVSDINAYLQNVSRELQFRVDEALPLGRTIVSVIDTETKETIREFPSKEVLAMAHRLLEAQDTESNVKTDGLLFSDQA